MVNRIAPHMQALIAAREQARRERRKIARKAENPTGPKQAPARADLSRFTIEELFNELDKRLPPDA